MPVVVSPAVDGRSRLAGGLDDRDIGPAVLRNEAVRRRHPVGLPGFQGIDILGTAFHRTELPFHGKSFDRHFAHGVDLGTRRADLGTVDRNGKDRISRRGGRTRNIEGDGRAAVDQGDRSSGDRKSLRIATRRTAHGNRLVAVGIGIGEAKTRLRGFLFDEVALDVRRAVDNGPVGLRDGDRILLAPVFEVDGGGTLGGAVMGSGNCDPLELSAANAFRRRGREPLCIFGHDRPPTPFAAKRDLPGRSQAAGKADRIGLAYQIAVIIVAACRSQQHTSCSQQHKLIYSFHNLRFSGSQSFIWSSSPGFVPGRGCRSGP